MLCQHATHRANAAGCRRRYVPLRCSNASQTLTCRRARRPHRPQTTQIPDVKPSDAAQHDGCTRIRRNSSVQAVTAVALAGLHYFLATGNVHAAKLCLDVPEWVADFDPKDAIFHSPVFAIGTAVVALLLFPKLIKFSINYLALPAIIALLAWLAISHPQQTANSVYTVLEFIKDHPAAASIGIIVAAGVILGPDLLAGAAVAGLALLLAVQAGVIQLPSVQLPRVPGQQLVAKQIERAGKVIRQNISALDDADLAVPAVSSSSRSPQREVGNTSQQTSEVDPDSSHVTSSSGSSSSSTRMQLTPTPVPIAVRESAQPTEPASPPTKQGLGAAIQGVKSRAQTLMERVQESPAAQGLGSKVQGPGSKAQQLANRVQGFQPIQALRHKVQGLAEEAQESHPLQEIKSKLQGLHERVQESEVTQGVGDKVRESARGLGSRVQGLSNRILDLEATQGLKAKAQAAAKSLGSRAQDLSNRVQDSQTVQGLRDRVGTVVVATGAMQHSKEEAGHVQGGPDQQQQLQLQHDREHTLPPADAQQKRAAYGRSIDSILTNS